MSNYPNEVVLIDRESIEIKVGRALTNAEWDSFYGEVISDDNLWSVIDEVVVTTIDEVGLE